MRLVRILSLATLAALFATSVASAATDQAKFRNLLRKYAVDTDVAQTLLESFQKAKFACICTDGSSYDTAGYLAFSFDPSLQIYKSRCIVPAFGSDGAFINGLGCTNYVPLAK